jgi:hypothetical protein
MISGFVFRAGATLATEADSKDNRDMVAANRCATLATSSFSAK